MQVRADIARHISSRPLPSVTRAGIAASRLEPPWLASRRQPGEMDGIGLIDPDLARDLAEAAARHPRSAWCVTVTDQDGHAVGHGCARPQASGRAPPRTTGQAPMAEAGRPGFAFTAGDGNGPPGGYGTWQLSTGIVGQPEQTIALEPIATDQC